MKKDTKVTELKKQIEELTEELRFERIRSFRLVDDLEKGKKVKTVLNSYYEDKVEI